MNLNDYIASGILELYALNCLSEKEMAEVEAMLSQHPALAHELNRIYDTLEETILDKQITPPAYLKQSLRQQIQFNADASVTEVVSQKSLRIIRNYQYAVAACLALLIVSSVLAISYYQQLKTTQGQLALLNNQHAVLSDNLNKASFTEKQLQQEMQVLKSPDVKLCTMKGVPNAPAALALVYWNVANKETYIAVKNLPAPPPGMQYQLWAIADGIPLDAGVFDTANKYDLLQKVRSVMSVQSFAVTLEKEGGSLKPTLEKMVVIGNI